MERTQIYAVMSVIISVFALYVASLSYTQHYTDRQRIEILEEDIHILKGQNVKIGQKAPNFELQGVDGKMYRLVQYFGEKEVVLYGWLPKCPHCFAVLPEFIKYEKGNHSYIQILSITIANTDKEKQEVREFVKRYGLRSPVLFADDEFLKNYAPFATPCIWYLTKEGKYKRIYQGRNLVGTFLMEGT